MILPFWNEVLVLGDAWPTLADLGCPVDPAHPVESPAGLAADVWRRLCPSSGPVVRASAGEPPKAVLMLVDEAEESQFDILSRIPWEEAERLGAPLVVNAARGRKFHGNRGRPWHALKGNLHLSALFSCDLDPAQCGTLISATACLAACDAIREASDARLKPAIKWVNDVRIGGAKVSGILTAAKAFHGRIRSVLFGIGLNVRARPQEVEPTAFVPSVSCLADHFPEADKGRVWCALVEGLISRFAQLSSAPGKITRDYRGLCETVGRRVRLYAEDATNDPVTLRAATPLAAGVVERLDDTLGVVLSGRDKVWTSGRLAYEEECRALGF